jgi:hypothetical protein
MSEHATRQQLEAGLEQIRQAPSEAGELKTIVGRPAVDELEALETAEICAEQGLRADTWASRPSPRTAAPIPTCSSTS